jgi:hypothetical protein
MEDSIELGLYARPIDRGLWRRTHSPWVQRHDPRARCFQVGRELGHARRSPSATCVQGCAQHWGRTQAPRVRSRQAAQAPRVRRGCAQHWGRTQAPRVRFRQAAQVPCARWGLPSTQAAAQAPCVPTWFFFDSNNNFLKFINDDNTNNNSSNF